jgi:hypothetical protein
MNKNEGAIMRQDLEAAYNSAPPAKMVKVPPIEAVAAVIPVDEKVEFILKSAASEKAPNGRLTSGFTCVAVITDRSIYLVKQGMNFKSLGQGSESIPLHTITGITVKKGLLASGVEISRAGNVDVLNNCDGAQAEKWVTAARALLAKAPAAGGTTVIQQVDPLDQLKKLKELLDAGILTQEEFNAKKQDIMGKI